MGLKKFVCAVLLIAISVSSSVGVYADDLFDGVNDEERSEVAKEYLSEIIEYIEDNYIGGEVSTTDLVEAAIEGMAHSLDDYSEYYTVEEFDNIMKSISGTIYEVGIDFEIDNEGYPEITGLHEGSAASESGLRTGDTILEVNGVNTQGKGVTEIENMITRSSLEVLNIKISHRGEERDISVTLKPVSIDTVMVEDIGKYIELNENYDNSKVGYVKIKQIADNTDEELRQAVTNLKRAGKTKLILDLRGNTGGYVDQAIEICRQFVPAGRIIYTRDKSGNITEYTSYLTQKPFKEIAVLVDNMTASASEIIASAIQDSGAGIVVGKTTYGKGVMQSVIELSGYGYLKLTDSEYFSRTGKQINGVGVIPDIEIGDVLFVSEGDGYDSSRLRTALELLGYNTINDNKVKRSIGSFQRKSGLPVTYKVDKATADALNLKIYSAVNDTDRTLLEAYVNIMSEEN